MIGKIIVGSFDLSTEEPTNQLIEAFNNSVTLVTFLPFRFG